jgi:hypothetical protein
MRERGMEYRRQAAGRAARQVGRLLPAPAPRRGRGGIGGWAWADDGVAGG